MADLIERVRVLRRKASRLAKRASYVEEQFDGFAQDIEALERALMGASALSPSNDSGRLPPDADEKLLRAMAEFGVGCVEIKRRVDGSATVRIGGRPWFDLTASLADLLSIIADTSRAADDGLVALRPLREVAALLSKKSGRTVSKHALAERLSRLRQRMREVGENPHLIEVVRGGGVRFKVRALDAAPGPGSPVTARDRRGQSCALCGVSRASRR